MASEATLSLSPEEAEQILAAQPGGVLIGGAALAFWCDGSAIVIPTVLEAGVTTDVDFLGSKADATRFASNLRERYSLRVEVYVPDARDVTPETAKVVIHGYGSRGPDAPLEIDYLGVICGFDAEDTDQMTARAPTVIGQHSSFRVMHPLDLLKSRFHNIAILRNKQNSLSIAQAGLAIDVVRDWFIRDAGVGDVLRERHTALKAAEEIIAFARSRSAARCYREHHLDVLTAVPFESFATEKFREVRWPQAVAWVEQKRRPLLKRVATVIGALLKSPSAAPIR